MSSYHELIVSQIQQDRQRLANPRISRGAQHEVSTEAVAQHVNTRKKIKMERKYSIVRQIVARCQNVLATVFGRQAMAQR